MASGGTSPGQCKTFPPPRDRRNTTESVGVTFKAIVLTNYGETVKICGAHAALGGWDPTYAVPLVSSRSGHESLWSRKLYFSPTTPLEFKYIKVDEANNIFWEEGPIRTHTVTSGPNELEIATSVPIFLSEEEARSCVGLLQPPFRTSIDEIEANVSEEAFPCGVRGIAGDGRYRNLLPCQFVNRRHELQRTLGDIRVFVKEDLSVDRLNEIHHWLICAGLPHPARPLHRQLMMNRSIIITEQADLHLTWSGSYIYVKPLPRYLLCRRFWSDYLLKEESVCSRASGFLLSYTWLICYESDYLLATNGSKFQCLIPPGVTWECWQNLTAEFLDWAQQGSSENLCKIDKRYQYGELRLGRLNKIYRLIPPWCFKHIIRGYHYGYHQYTDFFARNFAWLIIIFAYITVVLTAMQVCLAIDSFKDDPKLDRASKGFAVFSMILVLSAVFTVVLLFCILCACNILHTIKKQQKYHPKARATTGEIEGNIVINSRELPGIFGHRRRHGDSSAV